MLVGLFSSARSTFEVFKWLEEAGRGFRGDTALQAGCANTARDVVKSLRPRYARTAHTTLPNRCGRGMPERQFSHNLALVKLSHVYSWVAELLAIALQSWHLSSLHNRARSVCRIFHCRELKYENNETRTHGRGRAWIIKENSPGTRTVADNGTESSSLRVPAGDVKKVI
jgi:hypothetical protein